MKRSLKRKSIKRSLTHSKREPIHANRLKRKRSVNRFHRDQSIFGLYNWIFPSNSEKGLFLTHDVCIKQLTGPIECLVLTRKDSFPIILFGDEHAMNPTSCNPCDEKNDCYDIASDEFIQLMNRVSQDRQIDFYLEYSLYDVITNQSDIAYPNSYAIRLTQKIQQFQTSEKDKKGWKHMQGDTRWHFVDIRVDTRNGGCRDIYCELTAIYFWIIESINNFHRKQLGQDEKDYYYPTFFQYTKHAIVSELVYMFKTGIEITQEHLNELSVYLQDINNTALVKKEIERMPKEEAERWKTEYYPKYVQYVFSTIDLKKVGADWIFLVSFIGMDMYYLSRSFKMKGTELNIGYFGFLHLPNIAYFLTDIMDPPYKIIYKSEVNIKENVKCVNFDKSIQLD